MTTPTRIYRQADTAAPEGALRFRDNQEDALNRILHEPTRRVLLAGEQDTGKTATVAEALVKLALQRGVIVGVKDTAKQWAERIALQCGPALRIMDSTAAGQANFAALLAGEDGWFFAGWEWFAGKDWDHRPATERIMLPDGTFFKSPKFKMRRNRRTKAATVECEPIPEVAPLPLPVWQVGFHGPAKPKRLSERRHLFIYKRRMRRHLDFFIFDESHKATNRSSVYGRTLVSVPIAEGGWAMALSGTFTGNKVENMWTTPRWLWPERVEPNFKVWSEMYLSTEEQRGTGGQVLLTPKGNPIRKVTGEKNEGAFIATLPCYIRMENPMPVPPPLIVHAPLSDEQRRQYDELEADDIAWLDDHPMVTELPITRRIRLRTATLGAMTVTPIPPRFHLERGEEDEPLVTFDTDCDSSVLAAAGPILRNYWAGQKVVIGCHSKKFVKVVVARLARAGFMVAEWSGDVPSARRTAIREAFERGPLQIIVAQIESFSTGLDGMQHACSKVLWLSESENNTENQQFIRRICRTGVTNFEHIKIIAPGTIAEDVHHTKAAETLRMRALLSVPADNT